MPPLWFALIGRARRTFSGQLLALVVCCAASLCFSPNAHAQDTAPEPQAYRLRFLWNTGAEPAKWQCRATIAEGGFSEVNPWGGDTWSSLDRPAKAPEVTVASRTAELRGAFDATVQAELTATLRVTMLPDAGDPVVIEKTLHDFLVGAQQIPLGNSGGLLKVQRVADDLLRVKSDRQQFIFSPGETFGFQLQAALVDIGPHTPLDLNIELVRGRSGAAAGQQQTQRVTVPQAGFASAEFRVPIPTEEGVYTLRLRAQKPSGMLARWGKGGGKALAERSIQFVVWDVARVTTLGDQERKIVDIDPTSRSWWLRMPEWKWTRRVPWFPKGPLGSSPPQTVATAAGEMIQLPAATTPGQPPWQAYPLPIEAPSTPHILEIVVPDDQPQELAITIFDRNAVGRATPLGDSLNALSGDRLRSGETAPTVVRKLFWPKTDSPMLVVSNHSSGTPARYGAIRVYPLPRVAPGERSNVRAERPVTVAFTMPQVLKALQVSHKRYAEDYVYEDWQAFYEAAVRLADYVEHSGANGAMVTVASANGTLYPTRVLGTQSNLDWEVVVSGVNDTPRKDLLELMLREFDRRGLELTPVLRLESAIPALEALRSQPGESVIDCLGVDGKPRPGPVRYNPLHPAVRQALRLAVEEVAQKGAGHPSFAGIAIDLTPSSHLVLPGDLWCAEPAAIDAFIAAKSLNWPEGVPRNAEFATQALTGGWRDLWRDWRSEQLSAIYGRLASTINATSPDAQLTLLTGTLLSDSKGKAALRPRMDTAVTSDQLLVERGVHAGRLAGVPNLVLAAPRYAEHSTDLGRASRTLPFNLAFAPPSSPGNEPRHFQTLHGARRIDLIGFQSRSPFGAAKTETPSTLVDVAVGVRATQASVEAALESGAGGVIEGGDAAPLLADARQTKLRRLLRQTPRSAAAGPEATKQPLYLKTLTSGSSLYLLAGNPTPWPVDAAVTLDAPQACTLRQLTGQSAQTPLAASLTKGAHSMPLSLPPHSAQLFEVSNTNVTTTGALIEAQAQAEADLRRAVQALARRDLFAKRPIPGGGNLSFETLDGSGLPIGWQWDPLALRQGAVRVGRDAPKDGQTVLTLTAGPAPVRVSSVPFPSPQTSQLVMAFHVKANRIGEGGELRVSFLNDQQSPVATSVIPASSLKQGEWRPFVFSECHLPPPGGNLRIAFNATNMSVSLDNIDLQSLAFPLVDTLDKESKRQRYTMVKLLQLARHSLEEGRPVDCQHALDRYWARYLMAFTPEIKPREPVAAAANQAEEKPAPKAAGGWKSYLPRFMR